MAKSTGLAWTTCNITDSGAVARDIRNDITNLDFATPRAVQDVTGIDKSAIERLLLLADFSITIAGVFNPTSPTQAHSVFSTVPSSSVARTVNLTVAGASLNQTTGVLFTDYKITRATSGALTFSAPGVLSSGNVPTWT